LVPTPIYLDYNATTPVHPEVLGAMMPFFEKAYGNPSSNHPFGAEAKRAVEHARAQVAALLGCKPYEIIFTSGGSESNNLAIKGVAHQYRDRGNHIITSAIEHPAVAEVCRYLSDEGYEITWLPVDRYGRVYPDDVRHAVRTSTVLISIMHANNEIGTIQPVREIAEIARSSGVFFHTDAAQSAGKVSVENLGVDLLSLAGHKMYAPKGIGALFVKEGIKLEKLIHGADHEHNLRAGTENVALIAGLGKACELAKRDLESIARHTQTMRDLLQDELLGYIPGAVVNGHPESRLPNTLSLSFPGADASLILSGISADVAASAGAACHAGGAEISATLSAINLPFDTARGTIRFSTGRNTTEKEIRTAVGILAAAYEKIAGRREPGANILRPALEHRHPKPVSPRAKPPIQIPEPGTHSSALSPQTYKLTQFTSGLGCACKLRPQVLEQVLKRLPQALQPDILVGTENSDDAAVYRISGSQAVVQTLDFFTPIVDDPYTFGAIAAANALSDIYAMGATPLFALNIVAFPSNRMPIDVLEQILQGASDKAAEAGIPIIGGHTIDDPEPKFGLAVTGIVNPEKILRNKGARPGDTLILTKPIGTGILATALKRGMLSGTGSLAGEAESGIRNPEFIASMLTLNKAAAEAMAGFSVSSCTDITGFGLLGHLHEMTSASGVDAMILAANVPVLPGAPEMASAGVVPGGTLDNRDYTSLFVSYGPDVSDLMKVILNDAQTSGGLLIALPEAYAADLMKKLQDKRVKGVIIGKITAPGSGLISII